MIGHSYDPLLPQLDITAPEGPVEVQVDGRRGVLYVSLEGRTVLRICRLRDISIRRIRLLDGKEEQLYHLERSHSES